jgi:hypothetical protein
MQKFLHTIARNFAFVGVLCLAGLYSNCAHAAAAQGPAVQRPEEGWICYICTGRWQSAWQPALINKNLWIETKTVTGIPYTAHISCIIDRVRNDAYYAVPTEGISVAYSVRKSLDHMHQKYVREAVRRKQLELYAMEASLQLGVLEQQVLTLEQALQQAEKRNVRYFETIEQLAQKNELLQGRCDNQTMRRRASSANTLG